MIESRDNRIEAAKKYSSFACELHHWIQSLAGNLKIGFNYSSFSYSSFIVIESDSSKSLCYMINLHKQLDQHVYKSDKVDRFNNTDE